MAKRSGLSDDSERLEWVKDEPEVIEFDLAQEGYPSKPVRLTKNVIYNYNNTVSGLTYTWNGAGTVVDVDERDIPHLLNKPLRKGCCGDFPTPYFEVLEG